MATVVVTVVPVLVRAERHDWVNNAFARRCMQETTLSYTKPEKSPNDPYYPRACHSAKQLPLPMAGCRNLVIVVVVVVAEPTLLR